MTDSSSRRNLALVVVAATSVLFALVAAEIALRVLSAPVTLAEATAIIHRRAADPEIVYELNPGAVTVRNDVEVRINPQGFRDDPFPEPSPEECRIVLLGDSVTVGWGVDMEDAYAQVLERKLNEELDDSRRATVLNMGVYGYSTQQEIRLLETRGLAERPDLIIVAYVLNDPDVVDGGQVRYFTRSKLALLQLWRDAWTGFRLSRDGREYHHRVHDDHFDEVEANFRRLGELSAENRIPLLLAVVPVLRTADSDTDGLRADKYPWSDIHDDLRRLSDANGLQFLDLRPALETYSSPEISLDGWHPNAKGHHVIADALASWARARCSEDAI